MLITQKSAVTARRTPLHADSLCSSRKTPIAWAFILTVLAAFTGGHASDCRAQDDDPIQVTPFALEDEDDDPLRAGSRYYDSIPSIDGRPYEATHLPDGLLFPRSYWEWKNRLWQQRAISAGGYYSANLLGGDQDGELHGVSELITVVTWEPIRCEHRSGTFVVGFSHQQTLGALTSRGFADRQGLVETPDDLDTFPASTNTTLPLAVWEQEYYLNGEEEGWGFRVGQIFAAQFFSLAEYLNDDRRYLMARPLATAAAVQWVGNNEMGLGTQVSYWSNPLLFSVAVMDGNSNQQYPDFQTLFDGKGLLVIGEIGFDSDLGGPNESGFRLTASHLDPTGDVPNDVAGQSIAASGFRTFDNEWVFFGRWSRSFKRLTADYQELFALGVGSISPGPWEEDFLAFGFWAGDPSDPIRGTEYGMELNYRFQLTQALRVTPDLQLWRRKDPGQAVRFPVIWGLRVTMEY